MPRFPQIEISPGFYIAMAVAVLILPLNWLLAAATAACIHEIGHILTLLVCGGRVEKIQIGAGGAVIHTAAVAWGRDVLCTLAGPVSGFLLVLTFPWFPTLAFCGLIQTMFNLLPVGSLDGGQILYILLQQYSPCVADRVCQIIGTVFLVLILLSGIWLSFFLKLGFLPAAVALVILIKKNTLQSVGKSITIDLPKNSEVRL